MVASSGSPGTSSVSAPPSASCIMPGMKRKRPTTTATIESDEAAPSPSTSAAPPPIRNVVIVHDGNFTGGGSCVANRVLCARLQGTGLFASVIAPAFDTKHGNDATLRSLRQTLDELEAEPCTVLVVGLSSGAFAGAALREHEKVGAFLSLAGVLLPYTRMRCVESKRRETALHFGSEDLAAAAEARAIALGRESTVPTLAVVSEADTSVPPSTFESEAYKGILGKAGCLRREVGKPSHCALFRPSKVRFEALLVAMRANGLLGCTQAMTRAEEGSPSPCGHRGDSCN